MGSNSIDRYEILEELGKGTATAAYKAQDPDSGDTVILKVVAPEVLANPQAAQRFLDAVSRGREIRNPKFVAQFRSAKRSGDRLFIVRDFVEGTALERVIAVRAAELATPEQFVKLGTALCDAIRSLAVAGVVHGGLSPRNVILCPDGRIVLTDMGLSRVSLLGAADSSYDLYACSFLAPEQIERGEATKKTDIRAVALILQTILKGTNPLLAATFAETRNRVLKEVPSADARLAVALALDPAKRPEKIEQLKDGLTKPSVQEERGPEATAPRTEPKTDLSLPKAGPAPSDTQAPESEEGLDITGRPHIQSVLFTRTGQPAVPAWRCESKKAQMTDFGFIVAGQTRRYDFEVVNSEHGSLTLNLNTTVPWATVSPPVIPLASGDRRAFHLTISGDHPDAAYKGELGGEWEGGKLAVTIVRHRVTMRLGPVPKGRYARDITRNEPSCMLFLVDQSESMLDPFGTDPLAGTKAEGVAKAINKLLQALVIKCAKQEGIRNYFEVGVIGYGDSVGPALGGALAGKELVTVAEIANSPRIKEEIKRTPDPTAPGGYIEQKSKVPVWFDPVGKGTTPMNGAMALAVNVLSKWVHEHRTSYPPIVVNITDGMATDGNPLFEVERLRRIGTEDGGTLVFNCFVSGDGSAPLLFPDSEDLLPTPHGKLLFQISSQLPEKMRKTAEQDERFRGKLSPNSRGLAMNVDMATLIPFLEVGTKATQLR